MSESEQLKAGLSDKLTPKQTKAIDCLLTQPTTKRAAEAAGVGYATLRRWLGQQDFNQAFQRARTVSYEATLQTLQTVTSRAIETLCALMENPELAPSVRVNAAGKLLDAGFRSREQIENESRIAELEARFAALDQAKKLGM